eukprot:403355213
MSNYISLYQALILLILLSASYQDPSSYLNQNTDYINTEITSQIVREPTAIIYCQNLTQDQYNSQAIQKICQECKLDFIYDLSKTDWTEIDLPIVIEASLMKIFSELRQQFPNQQFYMGYHDIDMCFSTDNLSQNYTLEKLNKLIKPGFVIKEKQMFGRNSNPKLDFLLLKYHKNTNQDTVIDKNYMTSYQSLQVLPLMKDQIQLILQAVYVDSQNDAFNYQGMLSFIQSGIDLPFTIKENQKLESNNRQFILDMDKNHTLNEFIYTFQKMGLSINSPILKGISDYQSQLVSHLEVQIQNNEKKIQSVMVYFTLPDFAIMPEIYLRQVSANLEVLFDSEDIAETQAYININAIFTFNGQNYYGNIIKKSFDGAAVRFLDETKFFPEKSSLVSVKNTLDDFSRIISFSPHNQVFPQEGNYNFLMNRLSLLNIDSLILKPHIKLINQPLRVVRITGEYSAYKNSDSQYQAILTSINGELAVSQTLTFEGSQASNALWQLFNLNNLARRDKLEINAFKLLNMKVNINNIELTEYSKIFGPQQSFLTKGIELELDVELKKFCQADIFCMMLSKFYGSMFVFKLRGKLHEIQKKITLSTQLQDIKFNDKYVLDNAFLKMEINFENIQKPDIDIYILGDLIGEVQPNVTLKFQSTIQLSEEGILRLKGEMNQIYANAFNLNNMLNTTQMSVMTSINQDGQLSDISINGIGVFGADCYKVPAIPEIFSSQNPYPRFNTKQQQQMLSILNQSYIDEDKCETANINMIILPNNNKENYFKGKLNLVNLKQFYQIFFNKIADQLTKLTPENVREQELISHQVDLIYEPGNVYINGVQLTGAFIFNGLMNFHGLTSHIKIVMDPDYQKYLYFSIILPSFSISQQNIKFLSPLEYIDVLEDDQKAILNAFGAPKIEMQIPIEEISQGNTRFSIRGMISIMGMHQLVTADLDQQRLNVRMQGYPFKGLYKMDFKVQTIIQQGHISENIASIFGQFENNQNLRQIESYLNKGIQDWTTTGLQYLQAWRDRITNLQGTIDNIQQTTYCDPQKCPSYSQCSSNLVIQCQQYLQEYECVKYDDVCTDLQQKCTKISKVCMKKFQDKCTQELEICEEWQNICLGYDQKVCKKFKVKPEIQSNKICKVYDLSCNMVTRIDQDCFMHCTQVQQNYNQYSDLLKVYQSILSQTESLFGNLTQLNSHISEVKDDDKTFVQISNMTLEGLLDQYMLPQNTNISFELSYNSQFDNKLRLVRSAIDFQSNSETAKILTPFILEDLCNIYGIPSKLARRMNQIIEDIEGSIRSLQQNPNITADQLKVKFDEIVHSDGLYSPLSKSILENQSFGLKDRVSLVEKRLSQIMLERQVKQSSNVLSQNTSKGLQSEHINDFKNQYLLNEKQIYTLSEFLSDK